MASEPLVRISVCLADLQRILHPRSFCLRVSQADNACLPLRLQPFARHWPLSRMDSVYAFPEFVVNRPPGRTPTP